MTGSCSVGTTVFLGGLYPTGGTLLTNGGVSFQLANGPGNDPSGTGVIQAFINTFDDIPVSIANPVSVYALINSGVGVFGADVGSIEFKGTGGLDYVVSLIEGQNVRDHFFNFYNNSASDSIHEFRWGIGSYQQTVRLDEYQFVLPASFNSATLTDIILNGNNNTRVPDGLPFLAAATVTSSAPVPEPSAFALLGLGGTSLAIGAFLRRRR